LKFFISQNITNQR